MRKFEKISFEQFKNDIRNDRKLYDSFKIPKREITIYKTKLIKFDNDKKEINFEVECSKGTYIRTLCEDIAKKLGTVRIYERINKNKGGFF